VYSPQRLDHCQHPRRRKEEKPPSSHCKLFQEPP
jgi:hypothetical protein